MTFEELCAKQNFDDEFPARTRWFLCTTVIVPRSLPIVGKVPRLVVVPILCNPHPEHVHTIQHHESAPAVRTPGGYRMN